MAKKTLEAEPQVVAQREVGLATIIRICTAGWLIPGLGHLLLGRKWRGAVLFAAIMGMFLLGVAMKGVFFAPEAGAYLRTLGYFGQMCVGVALPAARFFGYAGGDPGFASSDYGTAYLVSAGMLNVLAVLDAYDIAMGRK